MENTMNIGAWIELAGKLFELVVGAALTIIKIITLQTHTS